MAWHHNKSSTNIGKYYYSTLSHKHSCNKYLLNLWNSYQLQELCSLGQGCIHGTPLVHGQIEDEDMHPNQCPMPKVGRWSLHANSIGIFMTGFYSFQCLKEKIKWERIFHAVHSVYETQILESIIKCYWSPARLLHLHIACDCFTPWQPSGMVVAKNIWTAKSEVFTIWFFT